jgi:hypothetical protein
MLICIDSSVLIPGFQGIEPSATNLLNTINPKLNLVIPRLVAKEVTRNLTTIEQTRRFYLLFQSHTFAKIIDQPVPHEFVDRYVKLGLPAKADAFIGAFAEWQQVDYLISANRHFLALQATAFKVVSARKFLLEIGA